MEVKLSNFKMEIMLNNLKPLLKFRDKVGYVAARNTRVLAETLTEYLAFKRELIKKYGENDVDEHGTDLGTISINSNSEKFDTFAKELEKIRTIEHTVELMTIPYDEVIGVLSGEEILNLDWMLDD